MELLFNLFNSVFNQHGGAAGGFDPSCVRASFANNTSFSGLYSTLPTWDSFGLSTWQGLYGSASASLLLLSGLAVMVFEHTVRMGRYARFYREVPIVGPITTLVAAISFAWTGYFVVNFITTVWPLLRWLFVGVRRCIGRWFKARTVDMVMSTMLYGDVVTTENGELHMYFTDADGKSYCYKPSCLDGKRNYCEKTKILREANYHAFSINGGPPPSVVDVEHATRGHCGYATLVRVQNRVSLVSVAHVFSDPNTKLIDLSGLTFKKPGSDIKIALNPEDFEVYFSPEADFIYLTPTKTGNGTQNQKVQSALSLKAMPLAPSPEAGEVVTAYERNGDSWYASSAAPVPDYFYIKGKYNTSGPGSSGLPLTVMRGTHQTVVGIHGGEAADHSGNVAVPSKFLYDDLVDYFEESETAQRKAMYESNKTFNRNNKGKKMQHKQIQTLTGAPSPFEKHDGTRTFSVFRYDPKAGSTHMHETAVDRAHFALKDNPVFELRKLKHSMRFRSYVGFLQWLSDSEEEFEIFPDQARAAIQDRIPLIGGLSQSEKEELTILVESIKDVPTLYDTLRKYVKIQQPFPRDEEPSNPPIAPVGVNVEMDTTANNTSATKSTQVQLLELAKDIQVNKDFVSGPFVAGPVTAPLPLPSEAKGDNGLPPTPVETIMLQIQQLSDQMSRLSWTVNEGTQQTAALGTKITNINMTLGKRLDGLALKVQNQRKLDQSQQPQPKSVATPLPPTPLPKQGRQKTSSEYVTSSRVLPTTNGPSVLLPPLNVPSQSILPTPAPQNGTPQSLNTMPT